MKKIDIQGNMEEHHCIRLRKLPARRGNLTYTLALLPNIANIFSPIRCERPFDGINRG